MSCLECLSLQSRKYSILYTLLNAYTQDAMGVNLSELQVYHYPGGYLPPLPPPPEIHITSPLCESELSERQYLQMHHRLSQN